MLAMQEMRVQSLGWEDPLEKENGNPLQYSCLENPMDRGVWQATVHRVAQSWDMTERLSTHTPLKEFGQVFKDRCSQCAKIKLKRQDAK